MLLAIAALSLGSFSDVGGGDDVGTTDAFAVGVETALLNVALDAVDTVVGNHDESCENGFPPLPTVDTEVLDPVLLCCGNGSGGSDALVSFGDDFADDEGVVAVAAAVADLGGRIGEVFIVAICGKVAVVCI
jgi:hypothetical protein